MWCLMKFITKKFNPQRTAHKLNIILQKLNCCPEKQPVDSSKQLIEILQQSELPKEWKIPRDLSVENIIGQIKEGVSTRSSISNFCRHTAFVSQVELKSI